MGLTSLVVLNHTQCVSEPDLARFVNALDLQLRRDVTPVWGRYLVPWVARDLQGIDPKAWQLHLWTSPRDATEAGMLGSHTTQGADHVPIGHVFLENCQIHKESWTSVASHEVIEMMGDEYVNLDVARTLPNGVIELWPRELCDPVQGVTYAVNGVTLSNFVYPEFFIEKADGPFDHCRVLSQPFEIHPSGYAAILTIQDGRAQRRDRFGASYPDWRRAARPFARKQARWSTL